MLLIVGLAFLTLHDSKLVAQVSTSVPSIFEELEEPDSQRAISLFNEGKYDDAIALAGAIDASLSEFSTEEKWQLLIISAHMQKGDYPAALKAVDAALEQFPKSIRVRFAGQEVCRFNNLPDRATEMYKQIGEMASGNSWRYRNAANQIVLGKCFLRAGADAKEVLDGFLYPARKRYPKEPEVYRAIGELALEKHDYQLAVENFKKVLELAPGDTNAMGQMAIAYKPSDSEATSAAVESALKINPKHGPSSLIVADRLISSEQYDLADDTLDELLAVNPNNYQAWSYKAAIAHLQNQPAKEGEFRTKALSHWQSNPEVDHIIGRELSEKYRFAEGEKYQRRAIVYDNRYLPAKMQLAHDLLRLGQELEGWKLADEVFDEDQYSVVAHNLVTLREEISKFKTFEQDGFVVRMDAQEAKIYGPRVLDLLSRAKASLTKKYESQLETPIFVEIFPRQQDFAIRTFGLPGGSGFLGVCFGRVITMNSPAAQGQGLTSWESVLWHEFCHVVTLQKTKNRMPRWLSEGISVYEENLADPAWGDSISVTYREMILGDDLTPVSKLSAAFLQPKSGLHLQFAYYESSLVVEHLIKQYGLPALIDVLDELSQGTPINDALRRHCAPVEVIDKQFAAFAVERAGTLAPKGNWEKLEGDLKLGSLEPSELADWNAEHPDNLVGIVAEGLAWVEQEQWDKAIVRLEAAKKLSPLTKSIYLGLAKAYQQTDQPEKEYQTLEQFAKIEADNVELFTKLLERSSARGQWESTKKYARKLLALNPLLTAPHRYLSLAAEKTSDDQALIESLSVLALMNPLDAADVHYRLASALNRGNQLDLAKRQVIMALEKAPRYRDAHALLLKIVEQQNANESANGGSVSQEVQTAKTADAAKTVDAADMERNASVVAEKESP